MIFSSAITISREGLEEGKTLCPLPLGNTRIICDPSLSAHNGDPAKRSFSNMSASDQMKGSS